MINRHCVNRSLRTLRRSDPRGVADGSGKYDSLRNVELIRIRDRHR